MAATAERIHDLTGLEVARVNASAEQRSSTLTAPSPRWLGSVISRIEELLNLPPSWDTYGSRPVTIASAELALDVLSEPVFALLDPPTIVPTSTGGLQAEWYADDRTLEIEFLSDQKLNVLFCDEATGHEDEAVLDYDLSQLQGFARQLRG